MSTVELELVRNVVINSPVPSPLRTKTIKRQFPFIFGVALKDKTPVVLSYPVTTQLNMVVPGVQ